MGIAHQLITRGWRQRAYEDGGGAVCLVGAARRASGRNAHGQALPRGWRRAITKCIPTDQYRSIEGWNDAPGRTFDDVLRVAKEADELLGL